MIKICPECGAVFETDAPNKTCSPECRAIRRRRQLRKGSQKFELKRKAARAEARRRLDEYEPGKCGSVCDDYCQGCGYYWNVSSSGGVKVCHYLIVEGRCRPCPAGKGCTVKVERSRFVDPCCEKRRKSDVHAAVSLPARDYEEP